MCPAGESREGGDPLWQGLGDFPKSLGRVGGKKNRSFHLSLTTSVEWALGTNTPSTPYAGKKMRGASEIEVGVEREVLTSPQRLKVRSNV